MIKIDDKEVEFIEGMTVADALNSGGKRIDQMVIVMVDNNVVSRRDLDITKILDNITISLLRLISGG